MSLDECGAELIAKAVAGDRRALEQLLLAHSLPLSLHIAARLPDSMKSILGVEDILQQTFVRAFQSIDGLEHTSERSFSSLIGSTRNRIGTSAAVWPATSTRAVPR